jgi:hypothetical protein
MEEKPMKEVLNECPDKYSSGHSSEQLLQWQAPLKSHHLRPKHNRHPHQGNDPPQCLCKRLQPEAMGFYQFSSLASSMWHDTKLLLCKEIIDSSISVLVLVHLTDSTVLQCDKARMVIEEQRSERTG